jgi:hypothetical protein
MLRPISWTLLLALLLTGSVVAQRGGGSRGGAAAGHSGGGSGRGIRGSVSARPFPRNHFHQNRAGSYFYPYLFPYDEPYEYDEPYPERVPQQPPAPTYLQAQAPQPPLQPKLIEVPGAANVANVKPLPPAIFILNTGERVETSRFLLRASDLSVTVDRRQRTIPFNQLDLNATLAANHERGINLDIPADPNEISLRF